MTSYRKFEGKLGTVIECGKYRVDTAEVPTVQLVENVTFPSEGTAHHRHIQSPLYMTAGEQERMTHAQYKEWRQDAMKTAAKRGVHLSQL